MKIQVLQNHNRATVGQMVSGEVYEVPDEIGEQLLRDFPDKFKKVTEGYDTKPAAATETKTRRRRKSK